MKQFLQARILDSAVFKRDIDVGHHDGHQLLAELDLAREKQRAQHFKESTSLRLKLVLLFIKYLH